MALTRSRMDFTRVPTKTRRGSSEHRQLKVADYKRDGIVEKQQCSAGYVSAKDNKICENIMIRSLKSHYCWEEMNKPGNCRRGWKSPNMTTSRDDSVSSESGCDALFLRKLLAMNKKQEMELNKKLATVLREEEYRKASEDRFEGLKRYGEYRIPLGAYESLPLEQGNVRSCFPASRKKARASTVKVQYDLNGRRVYYYSDVEEDEEEEEEDFAPPGKTETWINTTTVIKTKSDMACGFMGKGKLSSQRKSTTVMKQPTPVRDIRCQGDGADKVANKFFVKAMPPRDLGSSRGVRRSRSSQVAHCCEVAPEALDSARKKRVLKVWDYDNIPKTNQAYVLGGYSKQGDQFRNVIDSKATKNARNSRQKGNRCSYQ